MDEEKPVKDIKKLLKYMEKYTPRAIALVAIGETEDEDSVLLSISRASKLSDTAMLIVELEKSAKDLREQFYKTQYENKYKKGGGDERANYFG